MTRSRIFFPSELAQLEVDFDCFPIVADSLLTNDLTLWLPLGHRRLTKYRDVRPSLSTDEIPSTNHFHRLQETWRTGHLFGHWLTVDSSLVYFLSVRPKLLWTKLDSKINEPWNKILFGQGVNLKCWMMFIDMTVFLLGHWMKNEIYISQGYKPRPVSLSDRRQLRSDCTRGSEPVGSHERMKD